MGSSWAVRSLVGLGLVLGLSTAATAQHDPKISAGDQLKVSVMNTEIDAGPFTVDRNGMISYPYLGSVKVEGLTAPELAAQVGKALVAAQVLVGVPQVSVELTQATNKSVSVSGAVNQRGQFQFGGDGFTVYDALVKAGGASPDAGDTITLVHQAGDDESVSRADIESGDPAKNPIVQDGDRIIVAKAKQVFIDGQVNHIGSVIVEPGMTLRQALALAGGATDLGAVNRVRILRNGKKVQKIDLDKTIVQPGDTITVPKKFM
jgi:polysaccharide export outer membrane protein